MGAILVVGSVAFDTVKTPFGEGTEVLGGSAVHFSIAASFFAPVRLVAVVGEDFGDEHRAPLLRRGVDLAGLEQVPGRTFRWVGEYGHDLNVARTLDTQLNVFAGFRPRLPEGWADTPVLFLANIDPDLQREVLARAGQPRLVALDTMNFWIEGKPEALRNVLRAGVDLLFVNDAEIRQFTGTPNLPDAAAKVRDLGVETVVVKRGEHGVILFAPDETFALPGFPLPRVLDPTGAGDSFAGGFLGYLASRLAADPSPDWRRAAVVGSVMASYQVEAFSFDRTVRLTREEIRDRYDAFRTLTAFAELAG